MYDVSSAGSPPPWSRFASAGSNPSSTVVVVSGSVPPPISSVASAGSNPVPLVVPPVPVPPVPPPVLVFPPVAPFGNEVGMSSLLSTGVSAGEFSGTGAGVSGVGVGFGVGLGVGPGAGVGLVDGSSFTKAADHPPLVESTRYVML